MTRRQAHQERAAELRAVLRDVEVADDWGHDPADLVDVAVRRWLSSDRRLKPAGRTLANRITDLVQGFRDSRGENLIYEEPGWLEHVAERFGTAMNEAGQPQKDHASSFGAAAIAYATHRPDYAQAAVRWALDVAPGARVLDLGAGTGKLTATLVAEGTEVTAVEPDPAMLAELHRALPQVPALAGSAESIPLPDASVDAVLSGNAMHWFDMTVAGPEIARVLAPGGVLAGLWNVLDDRVDWVAGLAQVSGTAVIGPRDTAASWRAETAGIRLPGGLDPELADFPHGQRRTTGSLVATLATRAGVLVMPDQERDATLGRIRAFLASRPETADGEFTVPMLTCVLRARQR
jgi:SAM-dependent methyltransferase